MPNLNSKAGHKAMRTCVVCKSRGAQTELLSFVLLSSGIAYDPARRLQARKHYVCLQQACLKQMPKWRKRRQKGRRL